MTLRIGVGAVVFGVSVSCNGQSSVVRRSRFSCSLSSKHCGPTLASGLSWFLRASQECLDEYVLEAGDLFDAQAVQLLRGSDDLVIECVFLQSSGAPSRWYTYTHSQLLEGLLHNLERTRQLHHCDIRFPRGLVPYVCHCCCLCVSLSQLQWSRSETVPKHPRFMTREQLVEVYWCKIQLEKEARALRIRIDDMGRLGSHLQAGDLLAVWCLPVLSGSSVEAGGSA